MRTIDLGFGTYRNLIPFVGEAVEDVDRHARVEL
ncbi:hypothetical protein CA13_55860 [Planctomycetes bacterium CA13]|uniref:Uncharacterized protein n=1 Tax=Novipirellula herctigrandis TaxID=2527986 RepID=A0A5C5ZA72_9BACT|nr:hypothetical protein CA13_55860 [Planctomycetes bacterium CA13]